MQPSDRPPWGRASPRRCRIAAMDTPTIYVAGHTGLVGSAIYARSRPAATEHILTRSQAELDLTDQARPEVLRGRSSRRPSSTPRPRWAASWPTGSSPASSSAEPAHRAEPHRRGVPPRGAKRLIFLGSSCIYPREAPQPLKEEYLLTGPLEETNRAYAIAKIAGIELCRSLNREYGTDYLSLMPTNLYGPGDNFDLEHQPRAAGA